jgi:flagellar motor switch protein FliN/FliY
MSIKLDALEPARGLLDQFTETLAQVIESMAGQRPEIGWRAASGTFPEIAEQTAGEILWWEQPLQPGLDMKIWVGAPRATSEHVGALVLKAAGIETVELAEAKNTWLEILGQSLSVMARSVGSILGREILCDAGSEHTTAPDLGEWAWVSPAFEGGAVPPLAVAFSANLIEAICARRPDRTTTQDPAVATRDAEDGGMGLPRSRTMELLLDVDLPVSISFGKTQLPMKEVIKLTTGSIVELNRGVNEPVELLVNQCLIARGEVVVVEGNYGIRILEIASRQDRLRSLR